MIFKSIIGAVCTCLAVVSFNATAIPVEADWKNDGDGLVTYDEKTGYEWLDLTVTHGMSFSQVRAELHTGGLFKGFKVAGLKDVSTLWDNFGGDGIYDGWSTANNGLFEVIAPLMGDTFCERNGCAIGQGGAVMLTREELEGHPGVQKFAQMHNMYYGEPTPYYDFFQLGVNGIGPGGTAPTALIRKVKVPEPSVFALIASGVVIIGVARRKSRA